MTQIDQEFIRDQYRSGLDNYTQLTTKVGIWQSEQYVFTKHLRTNDQILDLGCGTGRTTFAISKLGFSNIQGVDLTPEFIKKAKELNSYFNTEIPFAIGDATALHFENGQFDTVIFSFNGIMSIPKQVNRDKALAEIKRVLKPGGTFIFTTHDRDAAPEFLAFWKSEEQKWNDGQQDPRLFEFGDLLTHSKNELKEIYIHIPNQQEIENWLERYGFTVTETFYRSDRFSENKVVLDSSGSCRFWVTRSAD